MRPVSRGVEFPTRIAGSHRQSYVGIDDGDMQHDFSDLEGFEQRHSQDELETCAAALFLAHHDVDHYERLLLDIET